MYLENIIEVKAFVREKRVRRHFVPSSLVTDLILENSLEMEDALNEDIRHMYAINGCQRLIDPS